MTKWNSTGDFDKITIYNSRDNGTTWKVIFQNTPNDGSFTWRVRGKASNQCLIRVAASDSDLDPIPSDTSDAVFSILHPASPSLEVTAPNGEEQLTAGSLFTITWETAGSRENVEIQYSTNSGQTWKEITGAAENTGKYDWNVPYEPSNNCLVRGMRWGQVPYFKFWLGDSNCRGQIKNKKGLGGHFKRTL